MFTRSHILKCIFTPVLMLIPVLAALAQPGNMHAQQGGQNRAGVVVQFGDGTARTYCVAFAGDSISGLDLLAGTGLEVKVENYGGMGAMVCKIGPDGCDYPEQPCACQSYGPGGVYWSYHHLKDGRWVRSQVGASSYRAHNGDVDGWAWSDGSPPALYTFEQICGASATRPPLASPPPPPSPSPSLSPSPGPATPPPSPTSAPVQAARPSPTSVATRAPTGTRRPAHTPVPTATAVVTAVATASATATSTPAPTLTPTASATSTIAATFTPDLPMVSATTGAAQGATVSAGRPSAPSAREAQARSVALTIGAAALLGLVLWAVLRRRAG